MGRKHRTNEDEGDSLRHGLDLHLVDAIHGEHEDGQHSRHRVHLSPPPLFSVSRARPALFRTRARCQGMGGGERQRRSRGPGQRD